MNEQLAGLPLRERVFVDAHWRVSHAWSALPGWLIATSRRHVASLAELDSAEVDRLGPVLRAASLALRDTVGCEKTYVLLFAEAEGHRHVHFHVVPRMPEWDEDERSASVFRFLNAPESVHVPTSERDRLAVEISWRMEEELSG